MIESFRKSAPQPMAAKPFNIPAPIEKVLSSGLKLLIYRDQRLPLISLRLCFNFGDIDEPADYRGLTSATTTNLTQGSESFSSKEIAEQVERLGASLSASASSDHVIVGASSLKNFQSDLLSLLAEVILRPAFPEKELNLYRDNTIKSLKLQRSQPDFLAEEQTARVLYGKHSYSFYSASPAEIEKLRREDLAEYHKKMFVPNRAVLVAVGDIEPDGFVAELEKLFEQWRAGEVSNPILEELPKRNARSLTIVDRPGSAQSNIVLANLAIKRNHPDYFPFAVMNQILGAGASSRLFMNLREEKGYTYGAYSSLDARKRAGAFEATAEVRTSVTGDSLREFFFELDRIRNEKASETEIRDAKNYLSGVFPIRAETQEGLTSLVVSQELYNLPSDYLQTYRENIERVSLEDVQRVARQYVLPEQMAIVIVGDANEILSQAREFASEIEVYDNEGNLQNLGNYGKQAEPPSIDVTGKWRLNLDFQGQSIPLSLSLKQSESKVAGEFESPIGKGSVTEGRVSGKVLTASATTEFQGQVLELQLRATVENDRAKGTLSADFPGMPPFNFEGNRES